MEKSASASASAMERDLEEWEFLSDDGFVDLARPDTGKGGALLSRGPGFDVPKGLLDVNYFVCPPPHLLLLPAGSPGSELADDKDPDAGFAGGIKVAPRVMLANQEVISQVFFRKLGESEFADMKMDSPPRSPTSRGVKPLAEAIAGPVVEYQEKGGDPGKGGVSAQEEVVGSEIEGGRGCWESFGFSIWRWRIKGVGALCSIGVAAAAATICIFVLSGRQRQKHQQQNQKLQFQIYHDDQSFKQVVQQAARLNQAISVVRGVPATRAHVSFGGYYDGL